MLSQYKTFLEGYKNLKLTPYYLKSKILGYKGNKALYKAESMAINDRYYLKDLIIKVCKNPNEADKNIDINQPNSHLWVLCPIIDSVDGLLIRISFFDNYNNLQCAFTDNEGNYLYGLSNNIEANHKFTKFCNGFSQGDWNNLLQKVLRG